MKRALDLEPEVLGSSSSFDTDLCDMDKFLPFSEGMNSMISEEPFVTLTFWRWVSSVRWSREIGQSLSSHLHPAVLHVSVGASKPERGHYSLHFFLPRDGLLTPILLRPQLPLLPHTQPTFLSVSGIWGTLQPTPTEGFHDSLAWKSGQFDLLRPHGCWDAREHLWGIWGSFG